MTPGSRHTHIRIDPEPLPIIHTIRPSAGRFTSTGLAGDTSPGGAAAAAAATTADDIATGNIVRTEVNVGMMSTPIHNQRGYYDLPPDPSVLLATSPLSPTTSTNIQKTLPSTSNQFRRFPPLRVHNNVSNRLHPQIAALVTHTKQTQGQTRSRQRVSFTTPESVTLGASAADRDTFTAGRTQPQQSTPALTTVIPTELPSSTVGPPQQANPPAQLRSNTASVPPHSQPTVLAPVDRHNQKQPLPSAPVQTTGPSQRQTESQDRPPPIPPKPQPRSNPQPQRPTQLPAESHPDRSINTGIYPHQDNPHPSSSMSWYASKTETGSRSRPQRPQRRRSSPPPGHHGQPQQQGYAAYYAGAEELFDSTSSSEEAAPHPMPGSGRYETRSREVHQARPLPVTRPESHVRRPPGPTDEETARSLSMQEDMLNVYNQLKRDQDALRSRDERDAQHERRPRPTRHSAPPDSGDREDANRARPRPERPRRSIEVRMTRDHHNNRTEDTGTSRHRQNQDGPQTTNSRSAERRKRNNEFIESLEEEMICPICMSIMVGPHQVTPCGHAACGACGVHWIETRASTGERVSCPVCRRAIDPTNPLTPARSLENAIKKWVDWKVAVEVEWQGLADFKDREECWKIHKEYSPDGIVSPGLLADLSSSALPTPRTHTRRSTSRSVVPIPIPDPFPFSEMLGHFASFMDSLHTSTFSQDHNQNQGHRHIPQVQTFWEVDESPPSATHRQVDDTSSRREADQAYR